MAIQKPTIPKGMRDFSAQQLAKRNHIFDTIRKVFVKYSFEPIETPTMEKLSTLTGKYGNEGDKLLFKVLNSGDFLLKTSQREDYKKMTPQISGKGLRYDLTVPFARYVVMHQNEITFPFKRYQIQPVWRADRPQKGRYREFYQCDADVVGSDSLINESELIQIYDEVFAKLGVGVTIKMNHRKILEGLAEVLGYSDKMIDITVAIDKLDKIAWQGVEKELLQKGLSEEACQKVQKFLELADSQDFSLDKLADFFANSEAGKIGIAQIRETLSYLEGIKIHNKLKIDISLARGLSYYTGCIFEVAANDVKMGSIGGGGRYDDLTSNFGLPNLSGVGISFGLDRIYLVIEELGLFPTEANQNKQVLFIGFDAKNRTYCLPLLRKLRDQGIAAQVYPDNKKIKKQFEFANKKGISYVIVVGSQEMETALLTFKNMDSGEESKLTIDEIITKINQI